MALKVLLLQLRGEAPELACVVVAKDKELPGAADAWGANVKEVSVAVMEASWGAVRQHREGRWCAFPTWQ